MIRNGTFTGGWRDLPPAPGNLINQEPTGWRLRWLQPGETLFGDANARATGVPECVHKLARQLPPNEQPGQPDALILAGDATYKIFHANAPFGASLSQTVSGLQPGSTATLTVPVRAHLHGDTDVFGCESGVWVNGQGGWVNGHDMGDRRWHRHKIQFIVPADGRAEVVIRVKSKWPRPKDFFVDAVTLQASPAPDPIDDPVEEPPSVREVGRQTIHVPVDAGVNAVRLDVTCRVAGQWRHQESAIQALDGVGRLDLVFLNRPAPGPGVGRLAEEIAFGVTGTSPEPHRVLGMDVSYAQGFTVDFEKAAAAGVQFCFMRAAGGRNEKDPNYDHNFAQAGRVGMLRGIYYYFYAPSSATFGDENARSPEGQARRFASLLKADAELGAVLDVEDAELTPQDVKRFIDEFQKHDPYGRPITIYTAAWFWNASRGFHGPAVKWAAAHPLWVAHYTHVDKPIKPGSSFQLRIPQPWTTHAVHQWTSVGGPLVGHGVQGLDLNYFNGSLSQLQEWARGKSSTDVAESARDAGATERAAIGTKYVTPDIGLRLRAAPSTDAEIKLNLPFATAVEVLEEGAWDFVRVWGQTGYVSSQYLSTENPTAGASAAVDFAFSIWPTLHKRVNQHFAQRPEYYKKISNGRLPGHEGIDLQAPFGTPYFCVAPGTVVRVSDKRHDGSGSPYGWHVVVDHGNGYSTLYAHASADIPVKVGDPVAAGQILAHSGNTGNSDGPHLHLTLKRKGHTTHGWPPEYMDPWPFLEPLFNTLKPPAGNLVQGYLYGRSLEMRGAQMALATLNLNLREKSNGDSPVIAVVPSGSVVRLLRETAENDYYFCEVSFEEEAQPKKVRDAPRAAQIDLLPYIKGNGLQYEVRNARGGQERFQIQEDGLTFYQVKNAQWEQFFYDNDFIYRDIDTSPGQGRYYRLRDADRKHGSRWLRRRMALGETYSQARHVQFYDKATGAPSDANSGQVNDTIRLAAHHKKHKFRTGIEVHDVLEVHWVKGPGDHTPREKYFYANGFGLVGWERGHQDPNTPAWSAISEIHAPGAREPFVRERVTIR